MKRLNPDRFKKREERVEQKERAFRRVVDENKKHVYYLALKLTGNHQDAEDLSQEVFIKVYRKFHTFRREAKMSSWLYRITVNTHINRNRQKMKQSTRSTEKIEYIATNHTQAPAETNPERSTRSGMIKAHIEKALSVLTERERSIFVLRHYQDMSQKDIGRVLEIKTGTVKSTLFRAVRKLRDELAFYKPEMEAAHE